MSRRTLEIETLADFDTHIRRARSLNGWFVSSLDLTQRSDDLLEVLVGGAVFLGCAFTPAVEERLRQGGALLFPQLPEVPFDPYRPRLYDADELYGTDDYRASPDAVIYAWARSDQARVLTGELACTLHDHAITDALNDVTDGIDPHLMVGIMGGHALQRTDAAYADAARLAAGLTAAGRTVLTGGGPGAMEAANLGAYLSAWPGAVEEALALLAEAPTYHPDLDHWVATARQVLDCWPAAGAGRSLSIPTWFYGHEPSNLFATGIAKYFANALREDTLLHRCRGGIVYLNGQAGTVQEIFQAVTENYYAADAGQVAPMILVGVEHWTKVLPAWPLLQCLGEGRPMQDAIACVDSVDEALSLLMPES